MEGWRQKEDEEEAMRKGKGRLQPCPVSTRQYLMGCGPTQGIPKKGQRWSELCMWEMTDFTSLRKKREHFAEVSDWGLIDSFPLPYFMVMLQHSDPPAKRTFVVSFFLNHFQEPFHL